MIKNFFVLILLLFSNFTLAMKKDKNYLSEFEKLPPEIICFIFSYLDNKKDKNNIILLNKNLYLFILINTKNLTIKALNKKSFKWAAKRFSNLKNLNFLNYTHKLKSQNLKDITKLTSLENFNFPICTCVPFSRKYKCLDIRHKLIKYLSKLSNIQNLDLRDCYHLKKEHFKLLSYLTYLRELNFSGCDFISNNNLDMLSTLSNITTLNLSNCYAIKLVTLELFKYLSNIENLKLLIQSNTRTYESGIRYIEMLTNLKKLDLSCSELDKKHITALYNLTNLYKLNLSNTKLKSEYYDSLSRFTNLKEINFCRNDITCNELNFLSDFKNLEKLKLPETFLVNDDDIRWIIDFKKNFPNLNICTE